MLGLGPVPYVQIPEGWRVQALGKGQFIASHLAGTPSFMVASADVLTPALGVRVPGVAISPYLSPDKAWRFLTGAQGLASNMRFIEVNPKHNEDMTPIDSRELWERHRR